MGEFMGI